MTDVERTHKTVWTGGGFLCGERWRVVGEGGKAARGARGGGRESENVGVRMVGSGGETKEETRHRARILLYGEYVCGGVTRGAYY